MTGTTGVCYGLRELCGDTRRTTRDGAADVAMVGGVAAAGDAASRDDVPVDDVLALLCSDDPGTTDVLLAAGAPCVGKTAFAMDALTYGLRAFGQHAAVMAVSGRQEADRLGDAVIREFGSMTQARPVTTLSAIAFRLIADRRAALGEPLPKLLNGAEQDALLRQVAVAHVRHMEAGEPCDTCALLREYFASDDWADVVTREDATVPRRQRRGTGAGDTDAQDRPSSARGINDAFVRQLRDMIARMNELGAAPDREAALLGALGEWSPRTERLHVQWRLAFELRREYARTVVASYPGEYRLDSSRLLAEGVAVVQAGVELPRLVVVDDVQDLTLAGFAFLDALRLHGVKLVLVGNPDEAVQIFRGSYPEYVFAQVRDRFGARELRIVPATAGREAATTAVRHTYRDLVASRVSLSIRSPQDEPLPLPDRPGKLPRWDGSLPIARLHGGDPLPEDGSVITALYRSPAEELDDVVWRITREHLLAGRDWNDMALIAHDNATVRLFGERLRRDGVPVRYSSVTRPLKDEPFVQGLFALLELARLRNRVAEGGPAAMPMGLSGTAAFVRSCVTTLMCCPLIAVGGGRDHEGYPARLTGVEAAMTALGSLAAVLGDTDDPPSEFPLPEETARHHGAERAQTPAAHSLARLLDAWHAMRSAALTARSEATVTTDDSLVTPAAPSDDDLPFGTQALYLLLAFGDTDAALASIQAVCGVDPHAQAFARLWNLVATVAKGLRDLPSPEPQYALWLAWDACGVASRWQREALNNTDAGRAANDRLDAAMRLFDYASGSAAAKDLTGFIAQVRAMRIEADSLAKTAPVDQAVTLTTPAGAAGRHWPLIWMPALQQGVWPNLAARNTMFGGEDLADVILTGALADTVDAQLESVLAGEQKGLLVAVTRATERVTISAVYSDDLTPSDFLYAYLPERFDRAVHADPARRAYAEVGESSRFDGLDMTPRGLVTAARVALATLPDDAPARRDALAALAVLADGGIGAADPANWPFVGGLDASDARDAGDAGGASEDADADMADDIDPAAAGRVDARSGAAPSAYPADGPIVTLSPSSVDGIWACPVCWLLENRFSGPRAGSTATAFGSLIHAVAQRASEQGLDLPGKRADAAGTVLPDTPDARIDAVRDAMTAIYQSMRPDPSQIVDPVERYRAIVKDRDADAVLGRIAGYFVNSNTVDYPTKNTKNFTVGTLDHAECERQFRAIITLDDILAAYNALDGVDPIDRATLRAIMGRLVDGWPEGMRDDLRVRLTGRMDRVEYRVMPGGAMRIRLIDYKTGAVPTAKAIVNDLQLVCYQLGLTFPETPDGRRPQPPHIAQSVLFHVGAKDAPALSYGAESLYQPPLFDGMRLNDHGFLPRAGYRDAARLLDVPDLDGPTPEGVPEAAWRQLLALRGTQAVWSLTMIARVFYAAAASRSAHLTAHPQPSHVAFCRMSTVCPACAGQIDTVFETRQA
ncbi:PD-(D/E)XK nuclease superfamily [Bifidobacterium ramosum]|uniref:PD-(D/E)XK nuclease superfamily n=3 Tax=Bifidobacterium ramosum TaxID=1798158 RepID=A0A6L4X271_9BIFI|nr:PD-(D/E)XK nuclease family protein [Bifidobacterium ramosum]KAB8287782.1 PD-(D/E)XK nuclease superfamily [Bifidobacterium ramosum]